LNVDRQVRLAEPGEFNIREFDDRGETIRVFRIPDVPRRRRPRVIIDRIAARSSVRSCSTRRLPPACQPRDSGLGGLTELAELGTAAVVPPDDPDALAEAIANLCGDRDRLDELRA
jgi:hypothetical protein